jgi:hypothetical protein
MEWQLIGLRGTALLLCSSSLHSLLHPIPTGMLNLSIIAAFLLIPVLSAVPCITLLY